MLVLMDHHATEDHCTGVEDAIRALGYQPVRVPGAGRIAICVTGNKDRVSAPSLERLDGVLSVVHVTKPYKLVSREVTESDTTVAVGDAVFGGPEPVIIAGPCSVETEARTLAIARAVKAAGATVFRAGAYKPRTNPYSFQGLGAEGLHTLHAVREETGLPVVTEVLDAESADLVEETCDIMQVGARNMQNYTLLRRLGRARKPVLLKRGLCATVDEWLQAAEYLLAEGNEDVILCERGVRTYNQHARNTLDLNVIPLIRRLSHLPVIVDPSHGVGQRERVRPMARAALACGAQGLIIEAHTDPNTAYSDGSQTVTVETLEGVVRDQEILASLEVL
ncbi:MAG: 3-deoxy-7-phosphoheptulonate synthase [Planctomycetes bacterium]|nr:3-deoxy-7-phosphoheptulonate synthase [Planctomycetota bacterium]